jgi:DNA-binding NarL/FixJ family response regulator
MDPIEGHILIADDHPLFRGALRQAFTADGQSLTISEAGSFDEANTALETSPNIDLVLLDLNMPGMKGLSGLAYLRATYPHAPILVVSGNAEAQVIRHCLNLGASGFLPKTEGIETMRAAIRAVLNGQSWVPSDFDAAAPEDTEVSDIARRLATLTPQQVRVLMMLSEGLLNKQIAYQLNVSEATIKAHVSAILSKLNVDSRTQAVIAAARIDGSQWQPILPDEQG